MKVVVRPDGRIRMLYSDDLDLRLLGNATTTRASHVEPTDDGRWTADMAPVGGGVLGPFEKRGEALAAERRYLESEVL